MSTQLEKIEVRLAVPPAGLGYDWRPLRREDVPALYDLLLAVEKADDRDIVDTLEDTLREFDDPWSNAETDSFAALTADGRVAAFGRTFLNPAAEEENRCFVWVETHPAHRADGLEDFMLDWAEARGVQRLQSAANGFAKALRYGLQDTQAGRIAQLKRRGYAPVRTFFRMRRDLREPIPDRPLPDGLTLRTFTADLGKPVQDALNEAFRDHWGAEPISDEDWQRFFLERSSFRPDLTYVAMDGGQVAGLSFNTISPEENARRGRHEGWVAELAVRRPWRKRGVATALLCRTMQAFKAEGMDYAALGVDTENWSGALRLYAGVGFRPVKRFIHYNKAVD